MVRQEATQIVVACEQKIAAIVHSLSFQVSNVEGAETSAYDYSILESSGKRTFHIVKAHVSPEIQSLYN